jgi:TRAP transporter 4TM/12TM fusion protein
VELLKSERYAERYLPVKKAIIYVVSLLAALFHIFIAYSTDVSVIHQRVLHVFVMLFIWYMYKGQKKYREDKKTFVLYDILALLSFSLGAYYMFNTTMSAMLDKGIMGVSSFDIIVGVVLMILIFDVTREAIGLALALVGAVFLAYALLGPHMPEIIAHKGYDISYITNYVAWTMEGIFGTPIGASVSFVTLYIIFGELLEKFGAGKFFIDLAYALTGRMKGGPAEAAVVSSALMGSINGSAVANVVTTGTFTIPLMKKVGYKPHYAGAVEAVASTGGQLLPPVMGAAAFIMADMTGIPYSSIIIAAVIPGLLYYLSLGISVYLEADKMGIKAEPKEKLPNIVKVLKEGWYFAIPIIVLIVALLGFGYSASYSAIFAMVVLIIIGTLKFLINEKRFPLHEITEALIKAVKNAVPVAIACACAGIVIGVVSMTGIGVKFTSIVFSLSGGNLFLMLGMIMLACIVLGMGLPSTAAYVIAATIGVPALLKAGIPPIAANMFVFYFAIISFITPPVAMAAYAAAGIAESNASKTGLQAFFLGLSGFIIPFIYIYRPSLLIINTGVLDTIYVTVVTAIALALIAIAFSGWLRTALSYTNRIVLVILASGLCFNNVTLNLISLILATIIIGVLLKMKKIKSVES